MTDDFQPVQGASIFVGNLSFASTAEDIQAAFSKFGPILKVALPGSERRHVGCVNGILVAL
jgi:RNA recognition motif-containing protein